MSGNYTQRQQALIDGVEYALDCGLDPAPEDVEEYRRITGDGGRDDESERRYDIYLAKYARNHGITKWEAHQHSLCRETAREYGLPEERLAWLDENL